MEDYEEFEDEIENEDQYSQPKTKPTKYHTLDEVVIHNTQNSFWVIIKDIILDLTNVLKTDPESPIVKYLFAFGGKDLSSYFNRRGLPRTYISPITGRKFPVFAPAILRIDEDGKFWWEDSELVVGKVTRQERPIRIINTLAALTHEMIVCEEDTIFDIQLKYKIRYNSHAGSYIWRKWKPNVNKTGRLFLNRTLTENGILPSKYDSAYPPSLWLFYSDDLTID